LVHVVADGAEQPTDDFILPFLLDAPNLHGRLVRMGETVDTIVRRHAYPEPVARLLVEALTLTAALSAALKFEGVFTLQTSGDGPVSTMVCDATESGALRGYAKVGEADYAAPKYAEAPAAVLLGKGYLAFTVDQGEDMERYQGIVELSGATLEESVRHYFRQSQQFQAALRLSVTGGGETPWRGGALMLQRLPQDENAIEAEEKEEAWQRAMVSMAHFERGEISRSDHPPFDLLFNLFADDDVRVFESKDLRDECRCSAERVRFVLQSLSEDELAEMTVDGRVTVTCEFCSATTIFDEVDLAALRRF
jgi:molecular chaperone Hsp33